jgi:hypothetical protein
MKVSEESGSGQLAPDDEVAALKLSWAIDRWLYREMMIRNGRIIQLHRVMMLRISWILLHGSTWIVHNHKLKMGEN